MLFIILTTFGFIYLLSLFSDLRGGLNGPVTRILRVALWFAVPLLITLLILRQYNIYTRGYWATRIFFWSVLLLIMLLFAFGNREAVKGTERLIYRIIFILPLASLALLPIPFFGVGIHLKIYITLIGDPSMVLYTDEKIRVEQQFVRFMGPNPPLDIYVKDRLFSYRDTVIDCQYGDKEDSLRVSQLNDSTYRLVHYAANNWRVPDKYEEFTFTLPQR